LNTEAVTGIKTDSSIMFKKAHTNIYVNEALNLFASIALKHE
jgi:hypothetical protein